MWGQACPSQPRRCKVWDHPHACGDKTMRDICPASSRGSSPRVWGQGSVLPCIQFLDGIIPTRVGTRVLCKQMVDICKDHPHACGDKPFLFSINSSKIGSSPRVWGQVTVYTCHTLKVRIIPTRVGTRNVLTDKTVSKQDHPHACGDKCH